MLAQQFLHDLWFNGKAAARGADDVDNLFMFILWICIVSFVILMGAMFWFVWKYRSRPGVPTQRSASHNTPLELAWSVGPLILLVFVFFWGFHGYAQRLVAPADAEVIYITGQKWTWSATYANGGSPGDVLASGVGDNQEVVVIKVPAGRPIKLLMKSSDVLHAFFIPAFRIKIDVTPNRYTSFWFEAIASGTEEGDLHRVYCAEYCGDLHSEMLAWIKVVSPAEFEAEKVKSLTIEGTPVEVGEWIWKRRCITCHTVDGSQNTGPTWQGIWGQTHEFTDGTTAVVDENYIRESILNPSSKIRAGFPNQMTSFQGILKDDQIQALIAFIRSEKVSGQAQPDGGEAPTQEPPPDGESTPPGAAENQPVEPGGD